MLKHGILGMLSYDDMTGYELKDMFEKSLRHFWSAQTSQIYRELQGMEKLGWVESSVLEQKGKPDKRLYHITEAGISEFHDWMDGDNLKPRNNPVLMKTFFMAEQDTEAALRFFNEIKQKNLIAIERYDLVMQIIESEAKVHDSGDRGVYWKMTLDYGMRQAKLDIEWCDDCIKKIKELM